MTDKKQPNVQPSAQASASETKEASLSVDEGKTKSATKPSSAAKHSPAEKSSQVHPSKSHPSASKPPSSKVAILALFIAIAAIVGLGGYYYWNMQQQVITKQNISQATTLQLLELKNKLAQVVNQQQAELELRFATSLETAQQENQAQINQLAGTIKRLSQNQPSDWLLHEAEYLLRIATRTLWLEQNTTAAIGLLQDADMRIKELDDPQYLTVRQQIRADIAALELMPVLNTEEVIMSLMGLNKQVNHLPLASVKIPDNEENEDNLTLSENTDDWRENLAKTWKKFSADFITVRRISGNVEPLMSPQHQQNLRENLSLKIQLAQWAASEQKSEVFQQSLADIQLWLTDYFDMSKIENQNFAENIQTLTGELIRYDYPSALSSLAQIRKVMSNKPLESLPQAPAPETSVPEKSAPEEKKPATPEPEKTAPAKNDISGEA